MDGKFAGGLIENPSPAALNIDKKRSGKSEPGGDELGKEYEGYIWIRVWVCADGLHATEPKMFARFAFAEIINESVYVYMVILLCVRREYCSRSVRGFTVNRLRLASTCNIVLVDLVPVSAVRGCIMVVSTNRYRGFRVDIGTHPISVINRLVARARIKSYRYTACFFFNTQDM